MKGMLVSADLILSVSWTVVSAKGLGTFRDMSGAIGVRDISGIG